MLEKVARAKEILEILQAEFGDFTCESGVHLFFYTSFGKMVNHSNGFSGRFSDMLQEKYGLTLSFACGCTRLVIVDEMDGFVIKIGRHGDGANRREYKQYRTVIERCPRLKKYLAWCDGFKWEETFIVVMEYVEPHAFIFDSYNGRDKFRQLVGEEVWELIRQNSLDCDLHEGNWGCVHGVPVLIDYA